MMKTAVFWGKNDLRIEETPIPTIENDKILIKIDACAICTWEQRVFTGLKKVDFPFIGGHELAGHIIEVGNNVGGNWKTGDKVVFGTNLACGYCDYCRMGQEQSCLFFDHSKQQPGLPYPGMGGLSEYLLVDPVHLFRYSNVSPLEASLVEPLSCVVHSIESTTISFGDFVLIVGAGIMGMFHLQLARARGAVVIVSDPDQERLEKALQLGAHFVVNPQDEHLRETILRCTDGLGVQHIFNTVPKSHLIPDLVSVLSNLGTLVLYSSFYPDEPVSMQFDSVHKVGQRIIGTANSNKQDFIKASRLISYGIIDVKPFITNTYPLDQINQAFEEAIETNAYRVVVEF